MDLQFPYIKIRAAGFIAYCDTLICLHLNGEFIAVFLDLIGTPANVQAMSSLLFKGESCRIRFMQSGSDDLCTLRFSDHPATCFSRKIHDNAVLKIMADANMFTKNNKQVDRTAVVFAQDLKEVQHRAYLKLDAISTTPMKPEWQEWLWEEVMQPEKLFTFSSFEESQIKEAYMVSFPEEKVIQEQILEGISLGYLT